MRYPYDEYTITAPYKKRGKLWKLGYHTGTDFVGVEKEVKAICSGTVRGTFYDPKGYGKYISIQAEDGKRILYCHLDVMNVYKGQQVKEGDVIGIEGSTGNSTGSHLHLEVRVSPYTSKSTIDPIAYIEDTAVEYLHKGGMHFLIIPVSKFKIQMWNKGKRTTKVKNYCSGGFFAAGPITTEPMGNLVVDGAVESETCSSYGNLAGNKLHTLCIDQAGNVELIETDMMIMPYYRYAISGIPVTLNYEDVSWSKVCVPQGWTGDELRPTKHICITYKDGKIIIIGLETKSKNPGTAITEIWKKLKPYSFKDVLLLDGGGSYIMDVNGINVDVTSGNRKINNIITYN